MPQIKAMNLQTIVPLLKGKKAIAGGAGTKLVGERLRKLGEMSPSGRSKINFVQHILIKKGDRVPSAFLGIPGLKVGRDGRASASYTDSWCQSNWNNGSDWGSDSWGECWDNSTEKFELDKSCLVINTVQTGVKAFALNEFTASELKAISAITMVR